MTRAADLAQEWETALHSLKGLPHVIDIRNLGLVGAIELQPRSGAAGPAPMMFCRLFQQGALGAGDR